MRNTTIDPSAQIHPTAIIAEGAVIGKNVSIGPYCVVGKDVTLDEGVQLISHASIDCITHIGAYSLVYPFASINKTQDLKYRGEPSVVNIGKHTTIREYVTIQPGTAGGIMKTVVGDNCLLMIGVHVAHDCIVGNNVVMANYATLAGHVIVEDNVIIGGLSAVKQFVRIGTHAMIGGMSGVEKDVVPYALIMGERANLHGVNIVGMKRHGYSNAEIQHVQTIYKNIFAEDEDTPFHTRVKKQREATTCDTVKSATFDLNQPAKNVIEVLFNFMDGETKCHFTMPKSGRG